MRVVSVGTNGTEPTVSVRDDFRGTVLVVPAGQSCQWLISADDTEVAVVHSDIPSIADAIPSGRE